MGAAAAEAVVSAVVGPRSSTMAPTGMASERLLPAQIGREYRWIRTWRHRIRQIRRFGLRQQGRPSRQAYIDVHPRRW